MLPATDANSNSCAMPRTLPDRPQDDEPRMPFKPYNRYLPPVRVQRLSRYATASRHGTALFLPRSSHSHGALAKRGLRLHSANSWIYFPQRKSTRDLTDVKD